MAVRCFGVQRRSSVLGNNRAADPLSARNPLRARAKTQPSASARKRASMASAMLTFRALANAA